ncbi:bifunctional isocitrate dehydrogenase kinase/phosphatase [Anaeromyxobacter sp. PSR-1]|uniref:bifunctional isocitrate dehydrogenase kinase/phosphatase n=1 Tax=Anaeromyxobacter sp. PSR-1 TaxID=1300915 RepID=UPI0005E2807A|nr:bifunctional isocitrate dehydrogenase kinase/phosphatase [Anaeromyxobacter sp. PSR-1]GAO03846.1 isocitrate dehydrogenase kinase/phosphatase [Anaeromyxobacter sp. PSR-1]
MLDERGALARGAAEAIRAGYEAYQAERARITARARGRFEARDWAGAQRDARERLDLRDGVVHRTVGEVRAELGGAVQDREVWRRAKEAFGALAGARPDFEIAGSFFNSVTRRVFTTVGVDPAIEFLAADAPPPREDPPQHRAFPREATTEALLARILRAAPLSAPFEDLARDARLAALELDAHVRGLPDRQPIDAIEVARPVFYRGKGAYLVGRIRRGGHLTPLVLALAHGDRGAVLDAILFTEEDVSIVFGFTRSYFHVELERPRAMVAFLSTLLPLKRRSELYTGLGYHKHGKAELYREVARHLAEGDDRFVPARGDRGLVMCVFTLPGLDVIFKVIRDRFAPPKQTTRREVMDRYRHVFRHDRAGRLVDAQEYEHLAFPAARFSPALLEELRTACGDGVRVADGEVAIRHLYAERRVTPLNLFVREADEWTARQAVLDFGCALRDLAATDTFPGDLLLKNFGVTRHGRVIFYDYDELTRVTDCNFRDLPGAGPGDGGDDGWGGGPDAGYDGGDPPFYVGPTDVFPEELLPFIGLNGRLREVFLRAHGELLTGRWWRDIQARLRAGEIVDIFPYREEQRLRHARP